MLLIVHNTWHSAVQRTALSTALLSLSAQLCPHHHTALPLPLHCTAQSTLQPPPPHRTALNTALPSALHCPQHCTAPTTALPSPLHHTAFSPALPSAPQCSRRSTALVTAMPSPPLLTQHITALSATMPLASHCLYHCNVICHSWVHAAGVNQ